jgi:hypothetical protein
MLEKVPTSISYTPSGEVDKWGFKVERGKNVLRFMKLYLDPGHKYLSEGTANLRASVEACMTKFKKTPEDVVADYLHCLWTYTIDHLKRRRDQNVLDNYSIRIVLTVPAVWSAVAKDKTLLAAKRAGLPEGIELVPEPEAAALAVLQRKGEQGELKVGDGFVVCDCEFSTTKQWFQVTDDCTTAGGGTVDLISYRIDELRPLKLRECAVGDGPYPHSNRLSSY